jgi:hypothetical protein
VKSTFAKPISSTCRTANRPEKVQIHCHLYRALVIEPVSSNSLHKNGNFCGLGWRLSANSRQGCRFLETRDFGQPHGNPIKCGTFNQYGPTLSS